MSARPDGPALAWALMYGLHRPLRVREVAKELLDAWNVHATARLKRLDALFRDAPHTTIQKDLTLSRVSLLAQTPQ